MGSQDAGVCLPSHLASFLAVWQDELSGEEKSRGGPWFSELSSWTVNSGSHQRRWAFGFPLSMKEGDKITKERTSTSNLFLKHPFSGLERPHRD